ncbi:succinylglutamate desuccinylase/aspartoacylase family protein [Spongiivirga sp. MCCC 1A20706]|uniref:succinylglutamate desuccinylase/aspartoacylase family protein n=1 Tax=Spongiivirga sp. MCCC 1A20706 TaxID=3160963 RepID=UPI003977B1D9
MKQKLIILFFVGMTTVIVAQNQFERAFNEVKRPSKTSMKVEFTDEQNNRTFLPISILKGKEKGPVFTIVAGVHGYEYPPIVATQKLLQEIDIHKIKGTLIIIPIANTGSFYTRTPFMNPQDKVNLNNAFPGKASGTVTYKIAHYITEYVIPKSDIFVDIHGGDASEDLLPFVCYYDNKNYPEQTKKAKRLSEISGFDHVVSYAYTLKEYDPAKYVFKQACKDGKVALSYESGKLGNVQEEAVSLIKNGVFRMLYEMEMYPKVVEAAKNKITYLNNQKYIRSDIQGIFYSDFKAGDFVKKGEKVGHITNEFGVVISAFNAPVSGTILYKIATPPVNIDDTIMCISYRE